ncbi:ketopantoate reductase family protein [Lysinibacillus sp. SGAir0095]|uniref:ketopantoate reductase family protein n=1 Tax=Lysinibacillus sp. SGAir0095 TaxID=2070463 RepID=UPI0010CCF8BD|nr:ketopantoate reductase family protein [Lysinibacillus sp. SGAir0095]QCR31019.1 2-dehydropantoate 2-reductase [Lysinibacillus sp. SGAir0095]
MKILVFGAGALGVYFGGRLLEVGQDVAFFVREKRAEQLKKEGLKIVSPEGDFESRDVSIYTSRQQVQSADLIILSVKGYHLDTVIPQIVALVEQTGACVLPLLNGIEHIEKLQEAVGKEKVMGGLATIVATLNKEGHVEHTNPTSTLKYGALHSEQAHICAQLEEIQHQLKSNVIREDDILKHLWMKYAFITALSGITSAMQLPSGFIGSNPATLSVAKKVVHEMSTLAEKEGVPLTDAEVDGIINMLLGFKKEATSSMHQDLRKGLPIEIEHLQGGALRLAAKYEVEIPVIETLYGVLKPYEFGRPEQ